MDGSAAEWRDRTFTGAEMSKIAVAPNNPGQLHERKGVGTFDDEAAMQAAINGPVDGRLRAMRTELR